MPLYNNERTLERALQSLAAQTHQDFTIIVSDDGSSDRTVAIASDYAASDPRIRVVRQPRNLNYGNFRWLLLEADTPYFMFAAGDDWWEPTFMERCLARLENDAQTVCAAARTLMHPADGLAYESDATRALESSLELRVGDYIRNPGDNSRMYGLFRTAAAQQSFPSHDFLAFDWAFCARTLLLGTYAEIPEVLVHREVTPHDRYFEYARRDGSNVITRVFPCLRMTIDVLRAPGFPITRHTVAALYAINSYMHKEYLRVHYPRLREVYRRTGLSPLL